MTYYYPFGQILHPLIQQDRSPKQVFVLGVYASAVHARWKKYGLNEVTIPKRPNIFCDENRAEEITKEILESEARMLVLLGDIPIAQYLNRIADVPYSMLSEYVDLYGYGSRTETTIAGRKIDVLPLTHPRQIGALGSHSEKWNRLHMEWEEKQK